MTDEETAKICADPEWGGQINIEAFTRLAAVMLAEEGPEIASRKAFDLLASFSGAS